MAKNILIVDDEPHFCEALKDFLTEKGHDVEVVHDGSDALESYGQRRPDVVLLDVEMPGKSGLETLRELKALDPEACVIVITGVLQKELHKLVMAEGAFDFISKPFNFDRLETALRTKTLIYGLPK